MADEMPLLRSLARNRLGTTKISPLTGLASRRHGVGVVRSSASQSPNAPFGQRSGLARTQPRLNRNRCHFFLVEKIEGIQF